MKPRRLSGLDAAFLAAETPRNHLHLMSVMILDPGTVPGGYSFETIRAFIGRSLERVPPLCRRLVEVPFGLDQPVWVDALPDLDLHVRRATIPGPGGAREVAALAAEMGGRPLDRSRPLWEMVVAEGLEGGRIAIVAKLHHCMMDGIAGMGFMASLFSRTPEHAGATPPQAQDRSGAAPSGLELFARALPVQLARPWRIARATRNTLVSALRARWELLGEPRADEPAAPVPRTVLNGPTSPARAIAYTSVALQDAKGVAGRAGATVNDVILALISGALRRHLGARGELPESSLVAAVPASLHEGADDDRANAYSMLRAGLATHLDDPLARLEAIREASSRAKRKKNITGGSALTDWMDVPSPLLLSLVARAYSELGLARHIPPLCNLLVSSVAGPPVPLYFGGARLLELYPFGPIYDGLGLNVTALSCEDRIDLGLVACREHLPDLWELADAIPEAMVELLARTTSARVRSPGRQGGHTPE